MYWLWLLPSIAIYIVLCVHVGKGAPRRGRGGFDWAFYAFLCSPFVAGFSLLLLGDKPPRPHRGTTMKYLHCPSFMEIDARRIPWCHTGKMQKNTLSSIPDWNII